MEGQSLGRRPPPVVLGDAQRTWRQTANQVGHNLHTSVEPLYYNAGEIYNHMFDNGNPGKAAFGKSHKMLR